MGGRDGGNTVMSFSRCGEEVSRFTLDVRNVARSTSFDSIRFDSIEKVFLKQWIYIYRTGMLDNLFTQSDSSIRASARRKQWRKRGSWSWGFVQVSGAVHCGALRSVYNV